MPHPAREHRRSVMPKSAITAAVGARFTLLSRLLHWSMAAMVITQLLLGVTMVASLSYYAPLLAIHRPLGLAVLAFAVVRLVNRLTHRPPPFLATMSPLERRIATWSEYLMYALLLAQPLIGWAMLSAAGSPITIYGPIHLPGIAPSNIAMYELLRSCHMVVALVLFLTFTAHVGAVLFHALVLRDRIIDRMALWPTKRAGRQHDPTPSQ
jgi:cytochrome b561